MVYIEKVKPLLYNKLSISSTLKEKEHTNNNF